jgi:hypothetical protein
MLRSLTIGKMACPDHFGSVYGRRLPVPIQYECGESANKYVTEPVYSAPLKNTFVAFGRFWRLTIDTSIYTRAVGGFEWVPWSNSGRTPG